MQCKCGMEMNGSSHTVKTWAGKDEWLPDGFSIPEEELTVVQHACECGRRCHKVWNGNKFIYRFN